MATTTATMTHSEANAQVTAWQDQLATAQQELASFDIGTFALEKGVDKGLERKNRLEAEVARCTAGLAVAQAQIKIVYRNEQLVHASKEEKEAADLEELGAVVAERIQELDAELGPLRQKLNYIGHRIDLLRNHAEQLRRTYGEPA